MATDARLPWTQGALPSARKATICMTQLPAESSAALAPKDPTVVTTRSAARSPSGEVMIRVVNPEPALATAVDTTLPFTSRSTALVVMTVGVALVALVPVPPATTSTGFTGSTLRYWRIRTSGKTAALLNVTVTLLATDAAMLA